MQRKVIQIAGIVWTLVYASIIVWIYATEPRSFKEVATNSQVAAGIYENNQERRESFKAFSATQMKDYTERNRALLHFIVTPTILLTVALLGGLRVDAQTRQFIFIAPPLVTLVLAILLGSLFVRAGAIDLRQWLALEQPMLTNVAHLLTLAALLFASGQAFNSVLPASGLLHLMFSFLFPL